MIKNYIALTRLNKPVGIWLLLFPTLSALFVAQITHYHKLNVSLEHLIIFTLGSILMRSAGCAINDYFDKNFDKYVERTKNRPLAKAPHLAKHALYLTLILALLSFTLLFWLNTNTILLAIVAFIAACTYPLFKRFFVLPQAYLGIAFSIGIPMSYTAQNLAVNWSTYLLLAANIALVIAYDTAYAMVDKIDDIKIGIKTSAIFFGKYTIQIIMLCYFIYLCINMYIGYYYKASIIFYILNIIILIKIILYDYVKLNSNNTQNYFNVFKNNQYIVILSFIAWLVF